MSLEELKRFLYTNNSNSNLIRASNDYLIRIDSNITKLIVENQGENVIKSIKDFANSYLDFYINKKYTNTNLDSAIFALASCSKSNKSEQFSHLVYETLIELSQTPFHLFAFVYYRKHLSTLNKDSKIGAHSGRGLKKAINKWYNQHSKTDLLYLLTAFKHSHYWSNKDLFKLYHVRPKDDGVNFVINYVMFGNEKINKDDKFKNETNLLEFIKDLEELKTLKNGGQIADLIRKHKFMLTHLPSRQRQFKEIWPALIENMNSQELCEHLHSILKHNLLDTDLENLILNKILNSDSIRLVKQHPITACLALLIYEQMTSSNLIKNLQQTNIAPDANQPQSQSVRSSQFKDALWNLFKQLITNIKSSDSDYLIKSRVALVVDVNTQMRNDRIDGLHYLSPIDVVSALVVCMHHLSSDNSSLAMFLSADKINKFNMTDKQAYPDLATFDAVFKTYTPVEKNSREQIFNYCQSNNQSYDAFIFLTANDSNLNTLVKEIQLYRDKTNKPNTKMAFLNLSNRHVLNDENKSVNDNNNNNRNLILNGWQFDSYFILNSFLADRF